MSISGRLSVLSNRTEKDQKGIFYTICKVVHLPGVHSIWIKL
jgi:hypothetical protein